MAQHAHHQVKAGIRVVHLLGVALVQRHRQPFGTRPPLRLFKPVWRNVEARHLRPGARYRDGDIACATGDIQHASLWLNIEAVNKLCRSRLIRPGDHAEITRHPRRLGALGDGTSLILPRRSW